MLKMRSPKHGLISRGNFGISCHSRRGCSGGHVDRKFLSADAMARFSFSRRASLGTSPVIFAFETKPLRVVCQDEARARAEFGADVAEALKHRLADLAAAPTGKDIIAGRPSTFGSAGECMRVDLGTAKKLVFAANNIKKPLDTNKRVDWSKVTRIKFLGIEDVNA